MDQHRIPGTAASVSAGSSTIVNVEDNDQETEDEEVASSVIINEERPFTAHEIRVWKESIWAVGLTRPTWRDESLCVTGGKYTSMCFTASVCWGCCRARRIGNMVVLSPKKSSTHAQWVVGPYWTVLVFVTIPLLSLISVWVFFSKNLAGRSHVLAIPWYLCNVSLFVSLLLTGCRNPGILQRIQNEPNDPRCTWNDQALTYRPPNAKYDSDCASVIEGFDHVCPWTGTAIGKKNMRTFYMFLLSVVACLLFNVALIILV